MSTQSIPRVAAGIRTGGQFAPTAHAPADLELGTTTRLPEWEGDKLEGELADALHEWTANMEGYQSTETCATELLGMNDRLAMVEAYGADRAEFLQGLRFSARAETYLVYPGNQFEPAEYSRRGVMDVRSGGKPLTVFNFGEDGPDIYGTLLSRAPQH